jgi:DNA helicase II / ATP-dependent DNA helicase PcrA
MGNSHPFDFPAITDDDVRWAAIQLGLSASAFLGQKGNDPRKLVIQSKLNLDVAACPGSGKTTVLIAKLAILARNWAHRTRGICVLSHTNVARDEIEHSLGNSSEGQRLLSYPHFIGTIHGFVNEYLALPWLAAQGYPIKMIDTDVCESYRWKRIISDSGAKYYLAQNKIKASHLRITDTAFNFTKKHGNLPCGQSSNTYKMVQQACENAAKDGYHCYDDMFVWARDMLARSANIRDSVRYRFPLLFIDEAQDNSDEQAALLKEIFIVNGSALIRQRFGDGNQAIYDFTGASEAIADTFPDASITTAIPDSFRFGQSIANLADPLGLVPYSMVGKGPSSKTLTSGISACSHTIFIFDDASIERVIGAYGDLLLETFSQEEIERGMFTAVGMVHKRKDEDDTSQHCPQRVGDYWKDYDPKHTTLHPTPRTFVQYVHVGLAASAKSNDTHHAIERIAQGLIRLVGFAEAVTSYGKRVHKHRAVLEQLNDVPDLKDLYFEFLITFTVKRELFNRDIWQSKWRSAICEIAENICRVSLKGNEIDAFLSWDDSPIHTSSGTTPHVRTDNIYTHKRNDREAQIKMGSIHSVKGQTHTATLVLETAWNGCTLEKIMPWLLGNAKGKARKSGVQEITRLKTHYVAMTRPSHLLCMAMHKNAVCGQDGGLDSGIQDKLRLQGWKIVNLCTTPQN